MTTISRRAFAAAVISIAALVAAAGPSSPAPAPTTAAPASTCADPTASLILYDTTGDFSRLGERYATLAANLVSPFGAWRAEPVADYHTGDLACATAGLYIGSTYDEPLPAAFLDDVAAQRTPIVWINENLWKLDGRLPVVRGTGPDTRLFDHVTYKGQALVRDVPVESGLSTQLPATDATVLATATGPDGAERPWALRSGSITYIGENPFAYTMGSDRALIFDDLLIETFQPQAKERHRALVRLEDISPKLDPSLVQAAVDALAEEKVPFALAVVPEYHDGKGGPVIRLRDRPKLVAVLKDAMNRGGTLIMHGFTHQLDGFHNPYSGETVADYEFFRADIDANDNVRLLGPVPNDSYAWAHARLQQGLDEFAAAGLPRPQVITPPHYAASAVDYQAMKDLFLARFDRGLYFDSQLATGIADPTRFFDQSFAYVVKDIHGMTVVPENLGYESPDPLNNREPRSIADIIASAKAGLVVRDGFAAFFWHPYLVTSADAGVDDLHRAVQGIRDLGYTFVGLPDVVPGVNDYRGKYAAASATVAGSEGRSTTKPWPVKPYQVLVVVLAIWLPLRWWRRNRGKRAVEVLPPGVPVPSAAVHADVPALASGPKALPPPTGPAISSGAVGADGDRVGHHGRP